MSLVHTCQIYDLENKKKKKKKVEYTSSLF